MLEMVFSLIITWSIGLLPPIIIRYVILRKPMQKRSAVIAAVILGFVNLVIFIALGSTSTNPLPKFLIGYVTYLILQSGKSLMIQDNINSPSPVTPNTKSKKVKWLFLIIIGGILGSFLLWSANGSTTAKRTDKNPENSQIVGNTYRNSKYKFRIKFPEGWEIIPGDGPSIVQKAVKGNNSISIGVKQVEADSTSSIKDILSLKEFTDSTTEGAKAKSSNVKLLNSGETKLDNIPTYWVSYSGTYFAMDIIVSGVFTQYVVLNDGNLYFISTGTTAEEFDAIQDVFSKSIATFVFENYQ